MSAAVSDAEAARYLDPQEEAALVKAKFLKAIVIMVAIAAITMGVVILIGSVSGR